jgi:predicted metal-binding protein
MPRKRSSFSHWVDAAVELGAAEARIVSPESVVTATWVRLKCQYGCGGWGRRLTCPPHSPTPETTRKMLDEYSAAVLVHCPAGGKSPTLQSLGDGAWRSIKSIVADLEREVFLTGHYKAFAFGSGPCDLCDECNLQSCEHPYQARPSMEAAGIDVYATARGNGFPIKVVKDETCEQNYYGLVLIE